jgi:hypothetical protein
MIFNILRGDNNDKNWVFGLPFWKKYQFIFDSDNKLIYFYNKNGKFMDEIENKDKNNKLNKKCKKAILKENKYLIIFHLLGKILFLNFYFKKKNRIFPY